MSPIVIVDNDKEECEFLRDALIDAGATDEFRCFYSCLPALEYLKTTMDQPLIIISDIELPQINGLLFKRSINEDKILREKNIPFIFFSTSANARLFGKTFGLPAQAYFQKPDNMTDLDIVAGSIRDYLEKDQYKNNLMN